MALIEEGFLQQEVWHLAKKGEGHDYPLLNGIVVPEIQDHWRWRRPFCCKKWRAWTSKGCCIRGRGKGLRDVSTPKLRFVCSPTRNVEGFGHKMGQKPLWTQLSTFPNYSKTICYCILHHFGLLMHFRFFENHLARKA